MLKENQLFENVDKVAIALKRLKMFEPTEGYYLAFSGGKDSCVIKQLAIEAGIKFDAHYSVTTIDPPDLIYYIREHHFDVVWDRPKIPFLKKLVSKGFPMRHSRWCCELYKERGGVDRTVILGVRKAESPRRSKRKEVEHCIRENINKKIINPILSWSNQDVWEFIKTRNLPYCQLYDEGWKRIGCLFCPMQSKKHKLVEMEKYPQYTKMFIKAFQQLYDNRKSRGSKSVNRWKDGKEMFDWWISGKGNKQDNSLWLFEG